MRKPADTEVSLPRQYKLNFNTFFCSKGTLPFCS